MSVVRRSFYHFLLFIYLKAMIWQDIILHNFDILGTFFHFRHSG